MGHKTAAKEGMVQKQEDLVVVVISRATTTVQAMMANGQTFVEVYGRTPGGEPDYKEGNFEDEPDLDEELLGALCCLQGPALAVMEQLIEMKGERQ